MRKNWILAAAVVFAISTAVLATIPPVDSGPALGLGFTLLLIAIGCLLRGWPTDLNNQPDN